MAKRPKRTRLAALVSKADTGGSFMLTAQKTVLTRKKRDMVSMAWVVKADFRIDPDPVALLVRVCDFMLAEHRDAIHAGVKADGSGKQRRLNSRKQGGAWRRAKEGTRPKTRGNITGAMGNNLERGPVRVKKSTVKSTAFQEKVFGPIKKKGRRTKSTDAAEAKAAIFVVNVDNRTGDQDADAASNAGDYVSLIQKEDRRGVLYHFVEGNIATGITEILEQWAWFVVNDASWREIRAAKNEKAKDASQ